MNDVEVILLLCLGICLFIIMPGLTLYCCKCKYNNNNNNNSINDNSAIHTFRIKNEYSKLLDDDNRIR